MNSSVVYYTQPTSESLALERFSAEERAILETVNQKVAGAESLEKIVDFLFDATSAISPCDRIGLAFVTEQGKRITARYARASYSKVILGKGYSEDLQGSSLTKLLEAKGVRVINDLRDYILEKPTSTSTALMLREGIRSSMTCPLVVDGRTVGILFRCSREPKAYDERQVQLHFAVSERLSQAVEKAYRIEELQEALHSYYEMLAFVSHELKSPLASIVMDGNVLQKGYFGDLAPKQSDKIGQMVKKAEFLLGLTREYLDLTRIESGKLQLMLKRQADLVTHVIEPAIAIVHSLFERQNNELIRDFPTGSLHADFDADLLRIVIVNLLSNAIKYSHPNGKIRLAISARPERLRISVWNEGPGFPETEKPKLFRKFSRLQTPELAGRKGTGVGLYTAWRIVQLHGGKISADSKEGQWAEFVVELPARQPS